MSPLLIGLGLAVLASAALNVSYLLQHAGSRTLPEVSVRRPLVALRGLLGSGWWIAGLVLGIAGWGIHVGALSQAPLSLVQAFEVGGLALTVPLAARAFGQRLRRPELWAIGVLILALAVLGLGAIDRPLAHVPGTALTVALMLSVGLAAVVVRVAGPRRRALAEGAAGGVLFGAADAATKALTVDLHHGLGAVLVSPWLAALALLSAGAFVLFQRGLQRGPAVPVIALMTVGTNAVAIAIGLLAFGDPLGSTIVLAALHLVAFVVAAAAGWWLVVAQGRIGPEVDEAALSFEIHARTPRCAA